MRKLAAVAALIAAPLGLAAGTAPSHGDVSKTAWDFTFTSIDGKPMSLSDYRGDVLMVVNTASMCGFTKQYAGLQALHEKYAAQGFKVIGVPSNDFGGQEPEGEGKIKDFCETNFGITFPMTEKYAVTGDDAHPFYAWARNEAGWLGAPKWNFHKYLVGRDGKLITSFYSQTTPESEKVKTAVEAALAQPRQQAAVSE